jgi:hypothetical protein
VGKEKEMCVSEEMLNNFLQGMTIDHIRAYSDTARADEGDDITGLQVWFPNGAFLAAYPRGNKLHVDLCGPDAPEREQLRDCWEADIHAPPPEIP